MVFRVFLALCFLSVSACATRQEIALYPRAAEVGSLKSVYISTTRELGPDGIPGAGRSPVTRYYRYDISIPPDRESGEIKPAKSRVNPVTDFVSTSETAYADARDFQMQLTRAFRSTAEKETLIYVHGFNNTFDEGILRVAQLSHDFGFEGVSVHYSWPSAGKPLEYEYDRDSILFARDGLEDLIETVRRAGARNILVVGHSMGTQLIMETLRQMSIKDPNSVSRTVDGVVLMSPDIDISVFINQAKRIGGLPEPFIIFVSQRDRLLRLSGIISGEKERVGNIRDVGRLDELSVQVVDVTEFSEGLGHNAAGDSPQLIAFLNRLRPLVVSFDRNEASDVGAFGAVGAVVLTVRGTTDYLIEQGETIAR